VLIRQAGSFYDETDEISKFFDLMKIDEKLKNIIIAKNEIGSIMSLEERMLELFKQFQLDFTNFREIHCDESSNFRIKMRYSLNTEKMINTQIVFCKEYEDCDFNNVLKLFYEVDSYSEWMPCISQSKTVNLSFNRSCITLASRRRLATLSSRCLLFRREIC
jgi:hypothetical protein